MLHRLSQWLAAQAVPIGICLLTASVCHAQEPKGIGASPLDTLLHTKLWPDVPEAKDFVRNSRPAPDSLAYQPLTGTDPERPKLKTKDELKALESELERSAEDNLRRTGKRVGVTKPGPASSGARQ
jgi:hypothetical protein